MKPPTVHTFDNGRVNSKTDNDAHYENCLKYISEFEEYCLGSINSQQDFKYASSEMWNTLGQQLTSLLVDLGPCWCRDPKVTVQIADDNDNNQDDALAAIKEVLKLYGSQYLGHLQIIRGECNRRPVVTLLENLREPPYELDPVIHYSITIEKPGTDELVPLHAIFRNFESVINIVYPDPDRAKEYKYRKPFVSPGSTLYSTRPIWDAVTLSYGPLPADGAATTNHQSVEDLIKDLEYIQNEEELRLQRRQAMLDVTSTSSPSIM